MITMEEYERQVNNNIELQQRIDKAIEYIENYKNVLEEGINKGADYLYLGSPLNKLEELLEILKGEDK